jgi:hypothetical protein
LPAGQDLGGEKFHFGVKGREVWEKNDRVGGVEPHTNDIYDGKFLWHEDTVRESLPGASKNKISTRLITVSRAG